MIKPVAIDKNTGQEPSLNFEFLRSTGIKWIQQLAGKNWTDFNLHDPGVTILEQLCFAITELAYRTDFPIQDLLANEKGIIDYDKNAFFLKEDILTTNPVTINDYRKVIIDEIDEVENVWLYPVKSSYSEGALTGLYKIYVQVKPEIAEKILSGGLEVAQKIEDLVRYCFVSKRNLCEDVVEDIVILKPIKITLEADIQIAEQEITEEVLANIYHHLENSLNLPVRYYAEKELLEQGYTIEEIYDGPLLKRGFIPDSELHDRKTVIDAAELIKSVSHIPGVLSVKSLKVVSGNQHKHNKPLNIPEDSFALLDIQSSEQHVRLFRDNFELPVKRSVFRLILQKIRESQNRDFIHSFNKSSKNLLRGKYHNNTVYHSIQDQFPKIYGIGREGLLKSSTKQRKAQAKQLKGYLLFFEQIMANYLSQLSNVSDVFSIDINKKNLNTYYKNPLYNVPDVKVLLKEFTSKNPEMSDASWEAFKKDKNNGYINELVKANETDQTFVDRKNRLFEHLLARFNEFVTIYPVELHSSLYNLHGGDQRMNSELVWKSKLLKNLPLIGSGRLRASNYLYKEYLNDQFDFASKMRLLLNIEETHSSVMLSSALDSDMITVEKGERKFKSNEKPESDSEEEGISWQGEMPNILINKDEIGNLFDQGRVISGDDIPNDAFLLKNQDVSLLKYAIDIKNFRIGPNPAKEGGVVLLYKAPTEEKWVLISRFAEHGQAMKSLKKLINYIKEVNIKSEGFYILEHILLRPDLESKSFGFRFIAKNGQKLMEHTRWMSFQEREDVLKSLLEVLRDDEEITSEKLAPLCKINLYAPTSDVPEINSNGQRNKPESKNLFNYFKLYAEQKDKFLSRFEMVVLGDDNSMINEDFFSLRLTVILPSWPARFQDKNFREAAENLFRLNSPAHVKIKFIWMNMTNLKKFETLYFDWKRFMPDNRDMETKNELRNALIQMLRR